MTMLAFLAMSLVGCGGGGDGGSDGISKAVCPGRFVAPGSKVGTVCASGCAVDHLSAANDGGRSSFALVKLGGTDVGAGVATVSTVTSLSLVTVNAPSGVSFPAGENAGAIV
ncbi:MAG: hypothetical protein Q8Q73_05315, partial [Stagnimonas sp.]|nr:hypothetical protein [Stagnimonas sp.]